MIERHWDGIAAYCRAENKVSLGFIEGLNNKIRVIQRRAYGLRDEEYLRLKVLTCMLPELWKEAKPPTRFHEDPKLLPGLCSAPLHGVAETVSKVSSDARGLRVREKERRMYGDAFHCGLTPELSGVRAAPSMVQDQDQAG